ncbi:MAG: hypothetical protein US89_C0006G0049 [Candidatus Peregrinibacteria bacterium GW2011_GWF2_38_29]|nr:MAG: hypothetical protein US89_C0006G0049 [Candidatus Peregrinibacteria bacterium GW2011_GWF2_38_29]HBB03240.1 hypothetical protein [Candidatus Peregrinibacteria bacterium]
MSTDKHINEQDDAGFDESIIADFSTDKVPLSAIQAALRAGKFIDTTLDVEAMGEARNKSEK